MAKLWLFLIFVWNLKTIVNTFSNQDLDHITSELPTASEIVYISDKTKILDEELEISLNMPFQFVNNVTLARELVSQPLNKGTVMFLDTDNVEVARDILNKVILRNYVNNAWFVTCNGSYTMEQAFSFANKGSKGQKLLSVDSEIFFIQQCGNSSCRDTVYQVFGNAYNSPTFKVTKKGFVYLTLSRADR